MPKSSKENGKALMATSTAGFRGGGRCLGYAKLSVLQVLRNNSITVLMQRSQLCLQWEVTHLTGDGHELRHSGLRLTRRAKCKSSKSSARLDSLGPLLQKT